MIESVPTNIEVLHTRDWWRVTLSSIGDAVITTDAKGQVTFLNPVAESLTGWTQQEAIGQPLGSVFRIINEDTQLAVISPTIQAFREDRIIKLQDHCLLIAKDGTKRPLDDSASPISDDKGNAIGVVLIFRDITERRKTERALNKALAYADDIIASLREPLLVLNGDLRVKTANRSFYESFHVSKEETENSLVYDLGNGQWDIPDLRELLNKVLSHNKSVQDFEVEHTFPVLGRKTMLLNARPFPPDCTHPELILLAVEDVSALRDRANELAEANHHKDEFLATLSHELRSPLSAILGWSQILSSGQANESDFREGLEAIERNAKAQAQLIEDLLDMSRIISGKVRLDFQKVDLAAIVDIAVSSVRPSADAKQISLQKIIDSSADPVSGDPTRLQQIVWNLLTNAIKFTPLGGKVEVLVQRVNGCLEFAIRDTGIGIKTEFLPFVFDRFRQADSAATRSHGGLGLGLSIVKNLVELHGGTITAESAGEGKGATFTISLPFAPARTGENREPPSINKLSKKDGNQLQLSGVKVLVVDDEPDSRTLIKKMLVQCSANVITATSAAEGFDLLRSEKPDVLVSDIGMPKKDGYEFIREIRKLSAGEGGKTPAIALTAFARSEDRTRAMMAGYQVHVAKPIDAQELIATIGSLVGRLNGI